MKPPENRLPTAQAEYFRSLHLGPKILILPNAWDIASAKIFQRAGFKAIATTSAGIAASLGYADGQRIPRQEMLDAVKRIASSVDLPVTADMEAGFGDTVAEIADTVSKVVAAGAVGLNLEDKRGNELVDASFQVEVIAAAKEAGAEAGVPVVINARTDAYLLGIGKPVDRFRLTVERGKAYREAGADCIFVPGLSDPETIKKLIQELQCPVNILAGPEAPRIEELERIRVARVSMGSGPMRATLALLDDISKELLTQGTFTFMKAAIPYQNLQRLYNA